MSSRLPDDAALGPDERPAGSEERRLRDFTMSVETLRLVPLALLVGALGAGLALGLLDLIGLVTNLVYSGRVAVSITAPDTSRLGPWSVAVPVVGGLLIGLIARFGSERIRGHGIPEAMETILVGGSKVEPRLAVLKPVSSAISIGTGGPFGAEGPIILTGGAAGSLAGQLFHLSAAERRVLLVAGAAAGMSAVFGTPVAAVLLAVELLLFEWRPRSAVMVGLASAVAALLRAVMAQHGLIGRAPLFPLPPHTSGQPIELLGALVLGIAGGIVAWILTGAVYGAEDAFKRLPLHWSWWPAIGGVVVGLGGLIDHRALGVGYSVIGDELAGRIVVGSLVVLAVVKLVIWSVALGSGTSGGILAPLLLIGAAAGGMIGPLLPGGSPPEWALLGMAATLAGVTRSPFTSIVFALELTHDVNALLPLLVACMVADLISILVLKRSILTEKVARRGFHVMREYAVDPLEALFVRDVMETAPFSVEPQRTLADVDTVLQADSDSRRQRLYPVIDGSGLLTGAITWSDIVESRDRSGAVADRLRTELVVAHPDETLREIADRMATHQVGVLPVVNREDPRQLCGVVSQWDLLRARQRLLEEERHRERVIRLRSLPRRSRRRVRAVETAVETAES